MYIHRYVHACLVTARVLVPKFMVTILVILKNNCMRLKFCILGLRDGYILCLETQNVRTLDHCCTSTCLDKTKH